MALVFELADVLMSFICRSVCLLCFWVCYQERKVNKEYTALAAAPVDPGHHIHYMRPDRYAPRLISNRKQGLSRFST